MNQKGLSQLILMVIVGLVLVTAGGGVWYYQQSARQNKSASATPATSELSSSKTSSTPVEQTPEINKPLQATSTAVDKKVPPQPTSNSSLPPCSSPTATNCQKQGTVPVAKDTGGYSFEITGAVYDKTDAPAMTDGTPVAGIVLRATGPKIVTTQTRTNGSFTLSFTNAPVGTYEVCITIPPGYRINPPSGCEIVIARLSEKYDKMLEFESGGHSALNGMSITFNILRQ